MSNIENTNAATASKAVVIGEFPCTQTQLRCWILDQLKPGNPALNVAVRWEIRGTFKALTIEAALRKIINRHEILRTCFVERDGVPRQQVVDSVDFRMSVIDLRNVPSSQREQRIMQIGEETASEPFNLSKPCLFRVSLLMVNNDSAFLLITAHQSCFDGYSIRVLGREVGEIAAAMDAGGQPSLPELPLQYGDFAMWQEEYLASYGFESERVFWRERLVGARYFEIPTDKPRGAVKTNRGDILSVLRTGNFGERMENAARENKVSIFSYGAAVISALLHGLSGESTILFGSQVAGRENSELENLIGVFINNVVMRFDLPAEVEFTDHVHNAGRVVTDALNNQNMPFNKLVELVNPVRDPSRNPLISVNFNCQKAFLEDHSYGGFQLISAPSQSPGVIYDLSFMMIGRPSGWRMSIEYNSDLFEPATIESFLQLWQEAYDLALSRPDAPISSFAELAGKASRSGRRRVGNAEQIPLRIAGSATASDTADKGALTLAQRMELLAGIWARVLDVPAVAPADNFFERGGHSLLALRMMSIIREEFSIRPDLELLFRKPTLRGFGEAIFDAPAMPLPTAAKDLPNPWELTVCKSGTGALSIYTLNHPFLFYRLASELSDNISVFNVHLFNASQVSLESSPSLEQFAAQAIAAMKIDATSGPVAIVGLCVNGVLAVEVSRQLRANGVDVRQTAVIDAWAPGYFRNLPKIKQLHWNFERRVKRVAYFTGRLLNRRMRLVDFSKEFNITLAMMRLFRMESAKPSEEEEVNSLVTDMLVRAAREYKVGKDDAQVMMFRSQANHRRAKKLLFGWKGAVSERTEVHDLEGWHEDSLTQNGIARLASIISKNLAAEVK